MKPTRPMTEAREERLRALYRKNFLGLVLLTPESLADEFPELVKPYLEGRHGNDGSVHPENLASETPNQTTTPRTDPSVDAPKTLP